MQVPWEEEMTAAEGSGHLALGSLKAEFIYCHAGMTKACGEADWGEPFQVCD